MKKAQIVDNLITSVAQECGSKAGTWSYTLLQELKLNADNFTQESTSQLFDNLLKTLREINGSLPIYKAAQLIAFLYNNQFPHIKIIFQSNLHNMINFLDFDSKDAFMVAAVGLMDSILVPCKLTPKQQGPTRSSSTSNGCKITHKKRTKSVESAQKKRHNIMFFLPSTCLSSSKSKRSNQIKVVCCSPPPMRAL